MDRIRNTIELAKKSWGLLQKDRELVALPVIGFAFALAVLAVFLIPGYLAIETTTDEFGSQTDEIPTMSYVLFAIGSILAGIVGMFFAGAVVAGAHERMTGGDPTVGSSISKAAKHLPALAGWSVITFVVGSIVRSLRERAGFLGRMILGGIELAWEVAAFLVVPAIVIDDKGPIDGFKTSASLLRQTWGENLAARVGFGLLGFVAVIPGILVAVALGAVGLLVVGVILAAIWIAAVIAVISTLGGIFQTALYMYATTGETPAGFEGANLGTTFAHR